MIPAHACLPPSISHRFQINLKIKAASAMRAVWSVRDHENGADYLLRRVGGGVSAATASGGGAGATRLARDLRKSRLSAPPRRTRRKRRPVARKSYHRRASRLARREPV